ncbi:hypothetical protein Droror1_Dr00016974 [Drosera rotundifolia]
MSPLSSFPHYLYPPHHTLPFHHFTLPFLSSIPFTMKQLIRRLSRVADSSASSSSSSSSLLRSRSSCSGRSKPPPYRRSMSSVPPGHFPVYVGDEMERFVVNAEMLRHPVFVRLLRRSAQEYGYEQQGVIRIPCRVVVFEQLLEAVRFGEGVVDQVPNLVDLVWNGELADGHDEMRVI